MPFTTQGFFAAQDAADAKAGFTEALATGETPEQAALRLQKARTFNVLPAAAETVTPQEEAAHKASLVDWAALQTQAPELLRRLNDPAFANLVKDDLTAQGAIEAAVWKLAPEPGTPEGAWEAARASGARGAYSLFGSATALTDARRGLDRLNELERGIAEGKTDAELFGGEGDPTGAYGRAAFERTKEAERAGLLAQLRVAAEETAWSNRMRRLFPQSAAGQAFSQAKGFDEAWTKFLENPVDVLAEIGPESLTQMAPALATLPLTGAAGLPMQALSTGAFSYAIDKAASLESGLDELGLNMADPKAIEDFVLNPENRDKIAGVDRKATLHGIGTALFDALSVGVASKSLVPKPLTRTVLNTAYRREFANMALQTPVQGAMGGAGEALGQVLSEGEISSWSDIVAEVVGEQFTAPIEVVSTGLQARVEADAEVRRAQARVEQAAALKDAVASSTSAPLDPETTMDQLRRVARAAGVATVAFDAQSFQQKGFDRKFADIPEVAAQLPEALATGGSITVPTEVYATRMAPNDEDGTLAAIASFAQSPSLEDTQTQAEATAQTAEADAKEAVARQARMADMRRELADIGREVGVELRRSGADREEARNLQAIIQTYVGAMAAESGESPRAIWERFGASFKGEPEVQRGENGLSFAMSSPEWSGTFRDFLLHAEEQSRFVAELPNVPQELTDLIAEVWKVPTGSVEIQLTKDTRVHDEDHRLSEVDWVDVANLPEEFTGCEVSGGRLYLYRERADGRIVAGVFEVSHSERRSRTGKGADVRLGLVTAYTTTQKGLAHELQKQRSRQEGSGRTVVGRRLPTVTTKIARGYYTGGFKRSVGPSSLSRRLAKDPQSYKQGPLGRGPSQGDYFPALRLIARWKNADRSTLLHETGHLFLDMRFGMARDLQSLAERTPGQEALLKNVQAVLDWFGVKSLDDWFALSLDEQRQYHEKFARSFEAYVMHGRAPVPALKRAFHAFARWLKAIYSVIANIPGAETSRDVQDMFDAMFLAEEQLRRVNVKARTQPFFLTVEESGLSPVEWERYNDAIEEMAADAQAEQTSRDYRAAMTIEKVRRGAYAELRRENSDVARIRNELEAEARDTPIYRAWHMLRDGTERDGKRYRPKFYSKELAELGYSEKQIDRLYREKLVTKSPIRVKITPDEFARQFGYANGNELVDELLRHPDIESWLDEQAVERWAQENPQLDVRGKLSDMAAAAAFNEARLQMLGFELQALERRAGRQSRNEAPAFDEVAYQLVSRVRLTDLNPLKFVWAAKRAARNARTAWAKGDTRSAIFFKRQEIYQSALAKAAKEARMEQAKSLRRMRDYRRKQIRGMDTRFLVAIQRALANMGFFTEEQLALNPAEQSYPMDLQELQEATGVAFDVSDELLSAITLRDTSYLSTVGGFREFADFIDMLDARGRRELMVRLFGEAKELEAVQKEVSTGILQNAEKHGRSPMKRMEDESRSARFKDLLERFGLNHARASSLAAVLDGSWTGKLTEYLIYPADRAATREESLKHEYAAKLDKILRPVAARLRRHDARTSEVLGVPLTTQQAWTMLLNYGNEGNRQRLLATLNWLTDGRFLPEGWDSNPALNAEVDERMSALFSEYLDDELIAAAERIWAIFEEMRKKTDTVAKAVTGRSPVWVRSRPFRVGERVLRGGYYPIVYDRRASFKGSMLQAVESAKDVVPFLGRGGVSDGHLQSRVKKFDKPLVLTTRALFEGLGDQISYVSWAQYANEARKVLNPNDEIGKAIVDRYGTAYLEALQAWLKDAVTGSTPGTQTDDIANFLRRNVSLAGIGLNIPTALLQVVGATQSVAYLGGRWACRGLAEFLKLGPRKAYAEVAAKSEVMQARMRTQFREVTEIQSFLNGTTGSLREKFMRAAYLPLTAMQMTVDLPTWLGAYEKALAEGRGEALAVADADRAVMNAQGSGRPSDLSRYERGGPWAKLFTVFYTFFNSALNIAVVSGKVEPRMKAAAKIFTILMVQPVLETFLREGASSLFAGGDDGESADDWVKKVLKESAKNAAGFNLGLLVGVRELSYVLDDYGYRGPAGLRKITDTGRALQSWTRLADTGELDEATLKATVSAFGVWTGLPVTPINRAISGANALRRGDTDNPLALFLGYRKE